MLHTKFRENRPTGSGEEYFLRVFTIYGCGSHLGHVTWTIYINFCFAKISPPVLEKIFEGFLAHLSQRLKGL